MNRLLLCVVMLVASTAARSDGISFNTVGQIDGIGFAGKPAGGGGCTMNGIFDLTNTCNDIYFIGGLK